MKLYKQHSRLPMDKPIISSEPPSSQFGPVSRTEGTQAITFGRITPVLSSAFSTPPKIYFGPQIKIRSELLFSPSITSTSSFPLPQGPPSPTITGLISSTPPPSSLPASTSLTDPSNSKNLLNKQLNKWLRFEQPNPTTITLYATHITELIEIKGPKVTLNRKVSELIKYFIGEFFNKHSPESNQFFAWQLLAQAEKCHCITQIAPLLHEKASPCPEIRKILQWYCLPEEMEKAINKPGDPALIKAIRTRLEVIKSLAPAKSEEKA